MNVDGIRSINHLVVVAPSESSSDDEELELGLFNRAGISPLVLSERPEAEDDTVPGPLGTGGGSRPDRELPACTDIGEGQLLTGSGAERQQITSEEEQLLLLAIKIPIPLGGHKSRTNYIRT